MSRKTSEWSQAERNRYRRIGWIYLITWGLLILAGIIAKRIYGHPDWMVFFHLPAAIFLIAAFRRLSLEYREEVERRLQERMKARTRYFVDDSGNSSP